MKYLLSGFFLFICLRCFSQDTDSLKKVITGTVPIRQRLETALTLCGRLNSSNAHENFPIIKLGIRLAKQMSDVKAEGEFEKDEGEALYLVDQPDSAISHYNTAAEIFKKIKANAALMDVYRQTAMLYAHQKDYADATKLYSLVLSYSRMQGNARLTMVIEDQLAKLYEAGKNYREALKNYKAAQDTRDSISLLQKSKDSIAVSYNLDMIGDVFGSMGQKSVTEQSLLKTIESKRSLNDTLAMAINYMNLGILYEGKKQYPRAQNALQQCLQYAESIHYADLQSSALSELANLFEQTGDFRQAIVYFKKHQQVASELKNENSSKSISALQTKYETTQKENQILQQRFEISRRNYWVAGITIILLLSLLLGYSWYKRTQLKQEYAATNAIIETEEKERKRIAQDLHDSVSQTMMAAKINLTVIEHQIPFTGTAQREQFKKAIRMVDDGFREVRTISHNMMPQALTESGLALVLKQFIGNIENDAIKINLFTRGFEEHFDSSIETILYRVLQECVNNVLKHAKASQIDISLIKDETTITLTIEDNGIGFDAENTTAKPGMGFKNMQNRIKFLKGRIEFYSKPGDGTLVSVYIPGKGER
jgi:two-component system NarL family sensor kinase